MRVLFFLTGFAVASLLYAQNDRGGITGTITDVSGAAIPKAAVVAVDKESGAEFKAESTDTGNYTFNQLPPGIYNVSVEVSGFKKFTQEGIRVFVAEIAHVDIALQLGSASETVTVTADAAMLKTENAAQNATISVESLNDLPINFGAGGNTSAAGIRNALTMVSLVPSGVFSSYSSIRLDGAPTNTFNIQIEGQQANNNRLNIRQDQVQPSVESLQEVSVLTSNFSPEYGQVTGGFVNFNVKSGTNDFHGSLFDYWVNEILGAGQPFTNNGNGGLLRPANRRYDFGGNIGGPVRVPKLYNGRNKTFFFFSYEEFYQKGTTFDLTNVPSNLMRSGNFSEALEKTLGTDPSGKPIVENTVYDPATAFTVNGETVTTPFPNDTIPVNRMDPVALKTQSFIPLPTTSGILNNWDQQYTAITEEYIPTVKIDQYFKNQMKFSFYFSQYYGPHYNGLDGLPAQITQARYITTRTNTYRLNFDDPLTPNFLVHVGVGYQGHFNTDCGEPQVEDFNAVTGLGIGGTIAGLGFPTFGGLNSSTNGGGMALSFGSVNCQPIKTYKPTGVANATWVKGNHTYKVGADFRIDALTSGTNSDFGTYSFSNAQTGLPYTQGQTIGGGTVGLPYASFLLGLVNSSSVANQALPQTRKPAFGAYIQDNWKVTRKLTLDYGVRYDIEGAGKEIHDRVSSFGPTTPNPSAGGILGATIYEGYGPGTCNCLFGRAYPYAIGPRFGFAYKIDNKTVFRGGWGVTYAQTQGGQSTNQSTAGTGGWNTLQFTNPTYGAPAELLQNGMNYSLSSLYNTTLNPGLYPTPGQVQAPVAFLDPNAGRMPRMVQWDLTLQRQITTNLAIEASYVGNRGAWFEADNLENLNAISSQRLASFGLSLNNPANLTLLTSALDSPAVVAAGFKAPYAGFPVTSTLAQALRPFPQFTTITVVGAALGDTWYDSLQAKATKRFSHGLDVLATFVFQRELDTLEGPNNVFNPANNKQISSLSQPFEFTIAYNYEIPAVGPNKLVRAVIGGWTFGGLLAYSSGLPIAAPTAQNNLNSDVFQTTYADRAPGVPLFLQNLNCHCINPYADLVLNPAAWSQPPAGQFGTAAEFYNDYRYERRPSESMSLGRIFKISEKKSFQIRAEFFNVFNRTYLNNPTSTNSIATTTYNSAGQLTSGFGYINPGSVENNPRNGQLVARFRF
ncbi:MAG: TonB-dependent receptor [Bryobacteraceae bacterium]|jgi:hypothetical protein